MLRAAAVPQHLILLPFANVGAGSSGPLPKAAVVAAWSRPALHRGRGRYVLNW